MRSLHILRHAKSAWDDADLDDHDRPLAPRGRRAASRMAGHIAEAGIRPDIVLCSSAARARETLAAFLATWRPPPPVSLEAGLYMASAGELLTRLRRQAPDGESLLLVGHNPGLQQLALGLIGSDDAGALTRLRRKLPTGTWIEIRFTVDDWLQNGAGRLVRFVRPRALG